MKLHDHLLRIDDPRRINILRIYDHYEDLIHTNPGSSHNHQAWKGGLADHLRDMYALCYVHYVVLENICKQRGETLPFTLGQAQVCIFLHDAEKFVVYGSKDDPRCNRFFSSHEDASNKETKEIIKWDVIAYWYCEFGLTVEPDEINAIQYTHGEGSEYRNDIRVMNELAAFVGNLDRTSARILHSSGRDLG